MAKHRLEQPTRGGKVAKRAVIAGSITLGSLAAAAGPALAAPITVPGVGTFEVPGVGQQDHKAPVKKAQPVKKKNQGAAVEIPNLGTFTVPGINPDQIPQQLRPHGGAPFGQPQQTTGEKAVRAAESKIGSPYSYGSAGPNAFDCSGLIYWSYKQAGKTIPRDSYGQLGGGRAVAYQDAKPGDVLIFNGGGHAGIYVGNGMFIHSSTYGQPVKKAAVKEWSLVGVRRY
ncbi:NLP/P60 protein [Gordonia bronchialis DSM 43247]|uniref:NLP/P60 protein n=1 Tax=Gordonia bronchialis (strain ATCC 25592 / DSM 43247 / BCRC 13721 / JCM 3198 / KCTC 3076 / NBRC 16047 / NCTC 10667) TaxID=526226 RepID=D0LAW4_GORB4|nr:C40 family peptidase [Gordonia bronchialis]ACY22257.1 NLP/P60 protein [Gordonia bronchialis DSM 43247]MCC3325048.1 C40 family peptidase [Gordonia bronchialis]QGS24205.1 NlpC/P60 family protein [Gordonia bronchialis]UAK39598.1 C40 family peptidase [Gordonia bronchialis]STQ65181.1 Probable endopeptidase cgR_2070 precursor [Gordonia bronchialis]